MEIREVFAKNLRQYRKAAGLSQEELAYKADIDRTYVSSLERCVYSAGIDVVDRLAKILGVEAADLLRRSSSSVFAGKRKEGKPSVQSSGRKAGSSRLAK
ncbi:helix-turn-helix transcriptional regulator [Methylocella sp. CPCC 101449]|uniref:helix-turn-helix domain-containing protein n=1 Tax=Methylocella sp. CPCC 101449 TaxID=2987531 RepID=UPI00288D3A07|nr:helix-turn-helix transcriptional regulator [Methylocella sp. CPCC 101449]MDT2021225.1 helix-turn-helix transcriptional regulator [Methylocella sp. CPCC 101449]